MRDEYGLRPIKIQRGFIKNAEGSALIEMGETMVLCTVSVLESIPSWLKGTGKGWVTAEYSMLPRATLTRKPREAGIGRANEISRIISRALRHTVDLEKLGELTLIVDVDVLQADGGTRTAGINGGVVAIYDALYKLHQNKVLDDFPFKEFLASVSIGIVDDEIKIDLDYNEDSRALVDMLLVLSESGKLIEIQASGEKKSLDFDTFFKMIEIAKPAISKIIEVQKKALEAL